MPTYVNLINFTGHGVERFRETVNRAKEYHATIERAGGKLRGQFWTMGPYDVLVLFDAPDDETATMLALDLSSDGNVRTTTLRAFDETSMEQIISRVS
jgi:uncharacterized protein with GYD domain